jgi:hypothetical protein
LGMARRGVPRRPRAWEVTTCDPQHISGAMTDGILWCTPTRHVTSEVTRTRPRNTRPVCLAKLGARE